VPRSPAPVAGLGWPGHSLLLAVLLAASLLVSGCGEEAQTGDASEAMTRAAVIADSCRRLEESLGLPQGAVSESSRSPYNEGADVLLEWAGSCTGESEIDLETGRILTILQETSECAPAREMTEAELNAAADRFAAAQGWNEEALAAERFTLSEAELIRRGGEPLEYVKTWIGHDAAGRPNQGLIDVRVDAKTGQLRAFYYSPG